ncbi:MAG: hypothetical protein OXR73_27165 [Myxococcales bacterium]|nr:hypothetical protein [Myxococcales bacterium]
MHEITPSSQRGHAKVALACCLAVAFAGCGGNVRPFPMRPPLWQDPDQQVFSPRPEEYFSPFGWDAADHTVFRPISRFLAVEAKQEAINVNALDEVPDSSWFHNRIGQRPMTEAEVARGACEAPLLRPEGAWTVKGAKPNGANPGFMIKAADGRRYLLKFDGTLQGERATAADVLGSRLYHAIGYFAPCNSVVFFSRDILKIDPEATSENDKGESIPLTWEDVDQVLSKSFVLPDGRYRASASLFLPGRPIGPWTYQDTRDDDPNDVIPHQHRRELRGGYVLAAWLNHFDTREQNTLAIWIEAEGGRGHVRHYYLDFGDCLGSLWDQEGISRRLGHAYYLDIPYFVQDTLTLGLREHPWQRARYGPAGPTLGYFHAYDFEPDAWKPGYPNPAFIRASERDKAWMARILAEIDESRLLAALQPAEIQESITHDEIVRILLARRQRLLNRYLGRLSPLFRPRVVSANAGRSRVCLRDAAVVSGVAAGTRRRDTVRTYTGRGPSLFETVVATRRGSEVCFPLGSRDPDARFPRYFVVDVDTDDPGYPELGPLRLHVYERAHGQLLVAGLERPESHGAPRW